MSNRQKPRNGAELLKAIEPQLAEVRTKICLRPDLVEEYNTAHDELDDLKTEGDRLRRQAEGSRGGRLASSKSAAEVENEQAQRKAAEKVRRIEQRMAKYEVEFVFHGMPKDQWRDLVDSNPPREGNQVDLFTGYNRAAVLDGAVRPSLVDPEFDDCETKDCEHDDCFSWQYLMRLLNAGQWDRMRDAASNANTGVAEVPKSQTASDILQKAAAASKQQSHSASAPAGSKAGSRAKSTTTTTPTESS